MIVKVQVSLSSSDNKKHMLVYNKKRDVMFQSVATKEVLALMKHRDKAYFNAKVVNTKVVLDTEAEEQSW